MKSINYFLLFTILILCTSTSFAQVIKNYTAEWKKVDELINKRNLPKSALEEVKKIYALAKRDNQDAQIVKSLIYTFGLQNENREDNFVQAIKELEKEIAANKEPAKSILKSLQGNIYWQYFQRNRWKFYNRTNTTAFAKEEIATWSIDDFHKKISDLYLQSLQQDDLLKATKVAPFADIITKGNARRLRPTLYDLLAHKALDYFKNDERDLKKPAYSFVINEPIAYDPAARFASHKFITRDSLSLHHKALLIYQELIRFHLNNGNREALIDIDIQRLEFIHQHSVAEDKGKLYAAALEHIINTQKNNPAATQASYLLAVYHEQLAAQYDPLKDTTNRYGRIKAKKILEKVLGDSALNRQGPVFSEGWTNSYNLLNEIRSKDFSFEVEKVNLPNQPFRSLIKYKNIDLLHLRLIKADQALIDLMQNVYDEKQWNKLLRATTLKEWQQPLPKTDDLQQHSVEIKIDALPIGSYILLASSTEELTAKKTVAGVTLLYVSNISYVHKQHRYFLLHRETGQPLAGAKTQLWQSRYDYKTSKNIKEPKEIFTANDKGFFEIKNLPGDNNYNYGLEVNYQNDRLFLQEEQHYYYYNKTNPVSEEAFKESATTCFLFTDRSIYRPGQILFYKGIVLAGKKDGSKAVRQNYKTTIFFNDVNGKKVDSLDVSTNEYGSFSGKFSIPQNLLNGQFSLQLKNGGGYTAISVEEYKRPKFYVEYDKIKASYKVEDSITVTGNAKTYSGSLVANAKVSYRVVRQPRFIYPWLFKGWWPNTSSMEIANGEGTTNAAGQFTIQFKAIADKTIDRKLEPVFDYQVFADITDINGETRSASNTVSAGYKSLLLNVNLEERINKDSLKNIFISTQNMNRVHAPATVTVSIFKLVPEQRLIRKRYWQQPDLFIVDKKEFIHFFPNDEYKDESDFHNWAAGDVVYTKTEDTKENGSFALEANNVVPGFYKIEITTKDKDGQPVKDIRFIELFDPLNNGLLRREHLWAKGTDKTLEPGTSATVQVGSSANNVFLIQEISKQKADENNELKSENSYTFLTLNNEKRTIQLPATEADRGGYGATFFYIKNNRFYQFTDVINVPWTNKELQIEHASFRDKTLPGSEEKWKIKISGQKGEKLAAEMLASMYDASLDQFKPHDWNKPSIWPTYSISVLWTGGQNFSSAPSIKKWVSDNNDYKNSNKQYEYLDFEQLNGRQFGDMRRVRQTAPGAPMADASVSAESLEEIAVNGYGTQKSRTVTGSVAANKMKPPREVDEGNNEVTSVRSNTNIVTRKNFNETAFFFPDLKTDKDGNIEFSFTMPEALTWWKLQTLAHTKNLAFGLSSKEVITQKELMVQPNMPRFLREGDHIELSAKIVNLSGKEMTGQAELQLLDATTNQPVDGTFQNIFPNQYFTVAAGGSEAIKFPVEIPFNFNKAIVWRIVAKAGNFSDGEEAILPVLTNKMLVTETMPLPMRGYGSKNFSFEKLLRSKKSESLQHHGLTIEYTSNPAWYVVQAIPYLVEPSNESVEQMWNRYYATTLATSIVSAAPRIKKVLEQWTSPLSLRRGAGGEADTAAFLSNLQKNEELKALFLQETPWVVQAQTEAQQKKNIALLFDMVRMTKERKGNLEQLKQMQSENGGFVWFKGGRDDRYMTQYIVTGIGRLKKLGAIGKDEEKEINIVLQNALSYLDRKIKEDYDLLIKHKADLKQQQTGYTQIQYLYMRSFFPEQKIPQASQAAFRFYQQQAKQFWMKANKYSQGMTAIALNRIGDKQTPAAILKSLKETSITDEELGMYWKDNNYGYGWFWWQAPIETQSLLIEAFSEISKDNKTVDDLRTWLVKNKQTNNWRTTKATADACYALLLQGTEWLANEPVVSIRLGATTVSSNDQKTEAGTGYFKLKIDGPSVKPEMGNIEVLVKNVAGSSPPGRPGGTAPSWGAVYWQYFEDLDKITPVSTPLRLNKKLFIEKNGDRGPAISPVLEGTKLKAGDKLKVRIELRVDRDMEYVHMKDMRASALEPTNVLSGYKWQGGLGYFESTKDASTNFFFDYLRKGTYVFEYPLFVTHTGNFSNGVTTIQCMYAPEFNAHSEGVRISVE